MQILSSILRGLHSVMPAITIVIILTVLAVSYRKYYQSGGFFNGQSEIIIKTRFHAVFVAYYLNWYWILVTGIWLLQDPLANLAEITLLLLNICILVYLSDKVPEQSKAQNFYNVPMKYQLYLYHSWPWLVIYTITIIVPTIGPHFG